MSVAYDTTDGNTTGGSLIQLAATLNIANSPDRFVVLTLSTGFGSETVNFATLGGVDFSLIGTVAYSVSAQTRIYVLYDPGIGTQTAIVRPVHSTSFAFQISVFNGIDQSDGYSLQFTGTGSAAATTATISTRVGDVVFAGFIAGGSHGDGSLSCIGATQISTRSAVMNGVMEHHYYDPAGATQTVAFALVGGNFQNKWVMNLRATSVASASSRLNLLPLVGAGA